MVIGILGKADSLGDLVGLHKKGTISKYIAQDVRKQQHDVYTFQLFTVADG